MININRNSSFTVYDERGSISKPDRIERPKPKPIPKPDFIEEDEFQV